MSLLSGFICLVTKQPMKNTHTQQTNMLALLQALPRIAGKCKKQKKKNNQQKNDIVISETDLGTTR